MEWIIKKCIDYRLIKLLWITYHSCVAKPTILAPKMEHGSGFEIKIELMGLQIQDGDGMSKF